MQKMQSTCTGKTPNNSLQHNDLQRQKMQKCITDLLVRVHFCSLYIYIIPIYILYIYNKYNPVKPRKIKQIQGKVISAFLHFPSCRPSRNFYTPPSGHTQHPTNPSFSDGGGPPSVANPVAPATRRQANPIPNSQPPNCSQNSCPNRIQQPLPSTVSSRLPVRPSACAREFRGFRPRKKSHFSALTNPSPWVMIDIDNRRGRGKFQPKAIEPNEAHAQKSVRNNGVHNLG